MWSNKTKYISLHEPGRAYGEKALIFNGASGKAVVLPYLQAAVLSKLDRFRTLPEHAEKILIETGAAGRGLVESALTALARSGLLVTPEELANKLKGRLSPREGDGQVTSLAWVTADRPGKLEESISSFAAACLAHGRSPRFAVYDDSRDKDNAEAGRRLIEKMRDEGKTKSIQFAYFGPAEKAEYKKSLLDRLADMPGIGTILDFALTGHDGANRNMAFLRSAGELFVTTDDDTQGRFARYPGSGTDRGNNLAFSSAQDPTDFFIYPGREKLLAEVEVQPLDILGEHEKFLGKRAPDLISAAGDDTSFAETSPESLRRLMEKGGRVLTTMTGVRGDSGMTHSKAVLTYDRPDRERLFAGGGYESIRLFRDVLRLAPRATLGAGPMYMSTHVGFDNREALPPFFPQFRSADGLFGFQIKTLFPDGLIGYLPFGVDHDPMGKRLTPEGCLTSWAPGMADTVSLLCRDFSPPRAPASNDESIASLGSYLRCIAAFDANGLYEYIRSKYLPFTTEYINILDNYLVRFGGSPEAWALDVEGMIDFIETHVADPDFFLPVELRVNSTPEQAAKKLRGLLGEYGMLLEAWPEILRAARSLNAESERR